MEILAKLVDLAVDLTVSLATGLAVGLATELATGLAVTSRGGCRGLRWRSSRGLPRLTFTCREYCRDLPWGMPWVAMELPTGLTAGLSLIHI